MKKLFATLFIVCSYFELNAQQLPSNANLVPNSGYEFIDGSLFYTGPTNDGELYGPLSTLLINNPICWARAGKRAIGFHTINGSSFGSLSPYPFTGNHNLSIGYYASLRYKPSTGKIIDSAGIFDNRSYAETKLYKPLVAGITYQFSMKAGTVKGSGTNPSPGMNNIAYLRYPYVLGNLGVYFSDTQLIDTVLNGRINVLPQIRFTSWNIPPLYDTFMYTTLTASYTALGGEQYLTIGNFDDYSQFNILYYISGAVDNDTLYTQVATAPYIDDVSLVEDSTRPMISLDRFTLGNDTAICPGTQIGGQPYFFHYWWNTGDTTRLITIDTPGKYWCTVDYGCSNWTDTINITTTEDPVVFNLPDTVLCSGRNFLAKAPTGNYTYHWSTGATAPSITLNNPGTYWGILSNTCGSSHTDTFTLTSTPSIIPGININTIPPTSLCAGTPITFITNDVAAGNTPTFQWYKNGTLIAGATSRTYTDAGLADKDTLTIALYSSEACPVIQPTMSNKVGVTVSPVLPTSVSITANPSGNISSGQPVIFTATPVNGGIQATYSWMVNNRQVPGSYGPTFTANSLKEGDVVAVRLESSEPCPQPALVYSNSITVHYATGIISFGRGRVSVYPNPVTNRLFIDFLDIPKEASFYLFDGMGSAVIRMQQLKEKHEEIALYQLASGIYTYNLIIEGEVYRGKVVKQ